jgi:hypothetical protein
MRRGFNKDLLPLNPPHKNYREYKRREYKTKQKRCIDLEILLQDYKKSAGKKFSLDELARRCGVHKNTVRRWFYGFCPCHLVWWIIARYFEPFLPVDSDVIYKDIHDTIIDWKEGG